MKRLCLIVAVLSYLVVALLLVIMFGGAAIGIAEEISTRDVPNQHIVLYTMTPFGALAIGIPKGYLNADKEGTHWDTSENYAKRRIAKHKFKEQKRKALGEYMKEHPGIFDKKQPI